MTAKIVKRVAVLALVFGTHGLAHAADAKTVFEPLVFKTDDGRSMNYRLMKPKNCDPPPMMTSDEYPAYATVIEEVFSEPAPAPARRKPGRPRVLPEPRLPGRRCLARGQK